MTTNPQAPASLPDPASIPDTASIAHSESMAQAPVVEALRALLTGFLEGVESALGELIDPARMAPEQALYFFAQRQLGSNQASIVAGTLARLADVDPAVAAPDQPPAPQQPAPAGAADLVDRACGAVRATAGAAISTHLVVHGMALQALLLEDATSWNELKAGALRSAFRGAAGDLDTDPRAALMLIRLFETLVLEGLEALPIPERKDHLDDALTLLPIGTWVHYLPPQREPLICRLQIADVTDQRLVFVNQGGFEVLGLPASRIDTALRSGALRIMTEADLLQRALQAMQPPRVAESD